MEGLDRQLRLGIIPRFGDDAGPEHAHALVAMEVRAPFVGEAAGDIALVGQDTRLPAGYKVPAGAQVNNETIQEGK